MLRLVGKALEVADVTRGPQGNEFIVTEVSVLTGKANVERCSLGRDFAGKPPVEGDEVELEVVVSAYATRNGAGFRLTALSNLKSPARPVAANAG